MAGSKSAKPEAVPPCKAGARVNSLGSAQEGGRPLNAEDEMQLLRSKAPNIFDYRTLHRLFGVSMRRITQVFKEQREDAYEHTSA